MFCNECGARLKEDQKFCTNCRSKLDQINPQSQSATSAAQGSAGTAAAPSLQPRQSHETTVAEDTRSEQPTGKSERSESASIPIEYPSKSSGISRVALWGVAVLLILACVGLVFLLRRPLATPPPVTDVQIASAVKAKLADDPNLSRLQVQAEHGVVTLSGAVKSDADKTKATGLAAQVPGVTQVQIYSVIVGAASTDTTGTGGGGSPPVLGTRGAKTVTVPGSQPWTETGIYLQRGDVVTVSASGGVSFSAGSAPTGPAGEQPDCLTVANGPYGWRASPYVANQLPCMALLGRVGQNGTIFYIGAETAFRAATAGELFLGVNDNNFGDNSGSWTATVVVNGANPQSDVRTSSGDIQSVDFRNFGYLSGYCGTKDSAGHMRPVHVSGGIWKTGTPVQDESTFTILNVTYGSITGDGRTEAVVHTNCASMANFDDQELYVLVMNTGEPTLLARLTPDDWGKGQENNGSEYAISTIRAGDGHLDVSFYAGGSHACAEWIVTKRFQWNGSRFVGTPLSRSKNACSSVMANPVAVATAQGPWLGFTNETSPQDREAELRAKCGNFTRVYVPVQAGSRFTDLCTYLGRSCDRICDWQGRNLDCNTVSLGGVRDGTRLVLCR